MTLHSMRLGNGIAVLVMVILAIAQPAVAGSWAEGDRACAGEYGAWTAESVTYSYDAAYRVIDVADGRNNRTNHIYDDAGSNTTLKGVSGRQFNANNQNSAFTYNNGNPTLYR